MQYARFVSTKLIFWSLDTFSFDTFKINFKTSCSSQILFNEVILLMPCIVVQWKYLYSFMF